jgi:hypothetical protein
MAAKYFGRGANSYVLCDIVSVGGSWRGGRGVSDEPVPEDDGHAFIVRSASDCRLHPRPSDAELLAEIGGALRRVYSELLREPIPEHLATIIERLGTRSLKPH